MKLALLIHHQLFAETLKTLLSTNPTSADDILLLDYRKTISGKIPINPDLLLIDISTEGFGGFDMIQKFLSQFPQMTIIAIISDVLDLNAFKQMVRTGQVSSF